MCGNGWDRRWARWLSGLAASCACLWLGVAAAARQQDPPPASDEPPTEPSGEATPAPHSGDGESFPVSRFDFLYNIDHPDHPSAELLGNLEVTLGVLPTGYVSPRSGVESIRLRLADAPSLASQNYHVTAIQTVLEAVRDYLVTEAGLLGVFVTPHPDDIADQGNFTYVDGRDGETALRVLIYTAIVRDVRTVGFGDRLPKDNRINHPLHERIRARSPFHPADPPAEGEEAAVGDLLRKRMLDDYLFQLNRRPGRRVDVAISEADENGVVLDYLVSENRPLTLYAQVSNTGTKQTNEIRERFGLIWSQVTNNDDEFSLEYVTAGFSESHAVIGSYDAPLGDRRDMRWRVFGSFQTFTASDVGFADEEFSGDSWTIGAEVSATILQHRELFLDAFLGARFQHIKVRNDIVDIEGQDDFFIPTIGLRLERRTDIASTRGSIALEGNWAGVAGTDEDGLDRLGRLFPDKDWLVVLWEFSHSFYLEPIFNAREWRDISNPAATTLAHEIFLSFRGQHALGNRLIPQAEEVAGGALSVRGYPESVVAGDNAYIATVEYRFHLPKSFPHERQTGQLFGEPFRWKPQEPYGSADWDLIFRTFLDVGRTENSDPLIFETDETLIGAGIGMEFSFRRNFSARVDWGFALRDILDGDVTAGSSQVHFLITFVF